MHPKSGQGSEDRSARARTHKDVEDDDADGVVAREPDEDEDGADEAGAEEDVEDADPAGLASD